MGRALAVAGADRTLHAFTNQRLLTPALEHGVDWEHGGIFRDGLRDGGAIIREKEFWQHAEALVGFLDGYERFGNERCLDAFLCLWQFVDAHMINHEVGEWRILLDRAGAPINADLGNPWKVAYHTGRAMLECTERLTQLTQV